MKQSCFRFSPETTALFIELCRQDDANGTATMTALIRAEAKRRRLLDACVWSEDSDDNWFTSCDNAFTFTTGDPSANLMEFCCYCGREIKAEEFEEEDHEEE